MIEEETDRQTGRERERERETKIVIITSQRDRQIVRSMGVGCVQLISIQ